MFPKVLNMNIWEKELLYFWTKMENNFKIVGQKEKGQFRANKSCPQILRYRI